jgi:hypothetical protein
LILCYYFHGIDQNFSIKTISKYDKFLNGRSDYRGDNDGISKYIKWSLSTDMCKGCLINNAFGSVMLYLLLQCQ